MKIYNSALLVDDDPVVGTILQSYLTSLSVQHIHTATDGIRASEIIKANCKSIDLVITDLNMPGIDGIQFLRRLRDSGFNGDLVIASGENGPILETAGAIAAACNLRLRGTISKPLSKSKLDDVFLVGAPPSATKQPQTIDAEALAQIIEQSRIVPYFQPKVDVRTLKIVGAEALVRGEDPKHGHLGAHQIIPAAREHGLMRELTGDMIAKSLLQLRDWDRQGIAINMALNIDPAELCELNLPDKLSGIVGDLGLEPDRVTVEVTEESFHSNYLAVMEVVARLRMKGFCTSADDFGTGRSNMDTLEALPFSELKIDRSFVSKALTHSFADAGARAAVKLAKSLNLKTVAEGVETTEQFDYVAELGVNIIQGFLFARPLPAEEFEAWYLTNGGFAPAQSPTSEMGLAV